MFATGANSQSCLVRATGRGERVCSGPEIDSVAGAARKAGVFVSLGINEGTEASVGCIWNSNVLIGPDGNILNHHRKLVPTFWEKLVWANGDGAGLRVVDTAIGKVGMLICGENSNPLARYSPDRTGRAGAHLVLSAGLAGTRPEVEHGLRRRQRHPHPSRGPCPGGEGLQSCCRVASWTTP